MKRKNRAPVAARRARSGRNGFPNNTPEWEALEERYSQIDSSDMRRLAELLVLK